MVAEQSVARSNVMMYVTTLTTDGWAKAGGHQVDLPSGGSGTAGASPGKVQLPLLTISTSTCFVGRKMIPRHNALHSKAILS